MRGQAQITITVINDGLDAAISSDTPPEDTSRLWLDTSVDPPILKRYTAQIGSQSIRRSSCLLTRRTIHL